MIREERVKREKRVQILGASACAEAYNTGVSGNCLVPSALERFLFLVFIKSFSLFKRYCPQGGVVSPLLMNIALHGMEEALVNAYMDGKKTLSARQAAPKLIRYADDFVVLHAK